jgi:hypothetical protein
LTRGLGQGITFIIHVHEGPLQHPGDEQPLRSDVCDPVQIRPSSRSANAEHRSLHPAASSRESSSAGVAPLVGSMTVIANAPLPYSNSTAS